MGAPDTPTGLPQLDPNDKESTIVEKFNLAMQLLEARTPSYFQTAQERADVWGQPGIYDRPMSIIGGSWAMWDGDEWGVLSNVDREYGWTPVLYSGDGLAPFANANNTNFTFAAAWLPVSAHLVWWRLLIGITPAGATALANAGNQPLYCSLPPAGQLSSMYLGGAAWVNRGGNKRTASWANKAGSQKQIQFLDHTGPMNCNAGWQTNDQIFATGLVSI